MGVADNLTAPERLTAVDLACVVRTYRDALVTHRAALNRLNVYPVPDGDTGTNMALTLEAVQKEIDALGGPLDMESLALCLSHGSLMGARGNSGVILSQILRGLAGAFGSVETIGPVDVAEAFSRASDSAYAAVSNPVEGTILTVARAAARAAGPAALEAGQASGEAGHGGANVLVEVLEGAREAAARALEGTTQQLPAFRAAAAFRQLPSRPGRPGDRGAPGTGRGGGYELGTAWAG